MIGKALSSSGRIEILELLSQSNKTVENLARLTGLTVANTSRHLQLLKQVGLVVSTKSGQHVIYELAGEDVMRLIQLTRSIAQKYITGVEALVNEFIESMDEFEPLESDELAAKMEAETCIVIDVRPSEEYASGHLAGAMSVPLQGLNGFLNRLDKDKEIIAYCRGPFCLMPVAAVNTLRKHGFRARRLADGYPEWKIAGLPVEVSLPDIEDDPIEYAI